MTTAILTLLLAAPVQTNASSGDYVSATQTTLTITVSGDFIHVYGEEYRLLERWVNPEDETDIRYGPPGMTPCPTNEVVFIDTDDDGVPNYLTDAGVRHDKQ